MNIVIHGDCKKALKKLINDGVQVDSIVTDPPYELGFMDKAWDKTGVAYDVKLWKLALQVLKPGGHLLAFGSPKTYHRMACSIEDAGFEIRDQIMWVTGQGFPKSFNISKAIDKKAKVEPVISGFKLSTRRNRKVRTFKGGSLVNSTENIPVIIPVTELAKQWAGWGTGLKPAHEPIVMARKPLTEKTVAENVIKWDTGAINIDGCRIAIKDKMKKGGAYQQILKKQNNNVYNRFNTVTEPYIQPAGRFPANFIHDGNDEIYNPKLRFFYCAKASKEDRHSSKHPTVKPISLIRYLCRLITPPNGTVLDMFAGTGTTGQAAQEEGFNYILIEKEYEYILDIHNRLDNIA